MNKRLQRELLREIDKILREAYPPDGDYPTTPEEKARYQKRQELLRSATMPSPA